MSKPNVDNYITDTNMDRHNMDRHILRQTHIWRETNMDKHEYWRNKYK